MENHGEMMMLAGDNYCLVHQNSLAVIPTVIWEQVGGMDERRETFTLQAFCSHLHVMFTCRKVLRHGASGFTSHPKEGVLRILSPLKIHCLCWV
jgi:hypothetical protein